MKGKETMNAKHMRTYETLKRVRDFGATRIADFPTSSVGGQMFAEVTAVVAELTHYATIQLASAGESRVGSATKAKLRDTLREDLRAISRTVPVISGDGPQLRKKFRLLQAGDERLLATARTFAEEAEPLAAEFAKHEMPADFIAKLKLDIDAFEAAVTEQNNSVATRVTATTTLTELLARGAKAMRHLDPIMRNKYARDKPTLAAWASARHVERHSARPTDDTTPGDQTKDVAKAKTAGVPAVS